MERTITVPEEALRRELMTLIQQRDELVEALEVADQLAEWVRVTVSVEGVFSNNLGAQAQAQGLTNLLTRYAATRAKVRGEADTAAGNQGVGGFPGHTVVRGEAE